MRAEQVKQFIVALYQAQEGTKRTSVLLLGGPGIGKTTAVEEAARELASSAGREFIEYSDDQADEILREPERYFVFHSLPLVGVEPVDLTGHPRPVNGMVSYLPLKWAAVMSRCPGMLFLDDFLDTQRPDVMSAAYNITLKLRVGYVYLHPGVQVVAASNTPEFSSLSQLMPAPLANRLLILQMDPPTVEEWAEWMDRQHGEGWDRRVLAFLRRFGEEYLFRPPKETETIAGFASPRSWSALALLLPRMKMGEWMAGLVGPELAQKFRAFLGLKVDLEQLLADPGSFSKLTVDEKYIACLMLAAALTKKGRERALPLLRHLVKEGREWLVTLFFLIPAGKRAAFLSSISGEEDLISALEEVQRDKCALTFWR